MNMNAEGRMHVPYDYDLNQNTQNTGYYSSEASF